MSKLRVDQLETLDGTNTVDVADIVDDINTAEVTTATGTQTLADALDSRIISKDSVAESFSGLAGIVGAQYSARGWHDGSNTGGGVFYYDEARLKSEHNGGTVISPSVPAVSTQAGSTLVERVTNFVTGAGETDAAGAGCYVLRYDSSAHLSADNFGLFQTSDDCTTLIQHILNSVSLVTFGNYQLTVNPDVGIAVNSQQGIYFKKGFELVSSAASSGVYDILKIIEKQNITIIGGKITGDRAIHVGTEGEFGYGVTLRASTNVFVHDLEANDCWGDGFYFGVWNSVHCDNVILNNCRADNNRRQGVSVTGGKNITFYRNLWTNTNGIAPQAGIDIEPNLPTDYLENINVVECRTEGNAGPGYAINIDRLGTGSARVSVNFDRCQSYGDDTGFSGQSINASGVSGRVAVNGLFASESIGAGITSIYWDSVGPSLVIDKPTVLNPNSQNTPSDFYGVGILIGPLAANTDAPGQINGNISVINPHVEDDRASPLMRKAIRIIDEFADMVNVSVLSPTRVSGWSSGGPLNINTKCLVKDEFDVLRRSKALTANEFGLSAAANLYVSYDNLGTAGTFVMEIDLPSAASVGHEMHFECLAPETIRVTPAAGQIILFETATSGEPVSASKLGSRLSLRPISDTAWMVTGVDGDWALPV